METKPFTMQSPEAVAKEYGGNKQKIAQASQLGLIDPTAAVLAGMFIDRMRSAAGQEQGPPQTVAQDVLVPQQAPPAAPPQGMPPMPPQGMAPPQGMPPMQGATPPAPMAPPQGMAEGGLAGLPIPDTMFDEPSNGSFANGGIVAFAEGDFVYGDNGVSLEDIPGYLADRNIIDMPILAKRFQERRQNTASRMDGQAAHDAEVRAKYPNGVAVEPPPPPMPPARLPPSLPTLPPPAAAGLGALAAPSPSRPSTPKPAAGGRTSSSASASVRSVTKSLASTAAKALSEQTGVPVTTKDGASILRDALSKIPTDALKAAEKDLANTPAKLKAQKKEDMWSTLAQIGFGMAASNSPSFLQAAGQAASAAMPGMQEAMRNRRAEEKDARKMAMDLENMKYGREADIVTKGMGYDQDAARLAEQKAGRIQQGEISRAEMAQRAQLQRESIAASERAARAAAANASEREKATIDRYSDNLYRDMLKKNERLPIWKRGMPATPGTYHRTPESIREEADRKAIVLWHTNTSDKVGDTPTSGAALLANMQPNAVPANRAPLGSFGY